jgi:flagellar biosynthetic protein FliR
MLQASVFTFNEAQVIAFALVLIRVSAFVVSWPVFGVPLIPNSIKILFALALAMVLFPVVDSTTVQQQIGSTALIPMVVREALIGLFIGFTARMFFFAVNVAGQMMSLSLGLAGAQLLNPSFNEFSTVVDQFQVLIATLFFLSINGHHVLIAGLHESFMLLPLGFLDLQTSSLIAFGAVVQQILELGLKMAAPVVIAILLMNVVMAVMGRAVPQVNVLVTSIPVNIVVGLVVMVVALPMMITGMDELMLTTGERLFQFLRDL